MGLIKSDFILLFIVLSLCDLFLEITENYRKKMKFMIGAKSFLFKEKSFETLNLLFLIFLFLLVIFSFFYLPFAFFWPAFYSFTESAAACNIRKKKEEINWSIVERTFHYHFVPTHEVSGFQAIIHASIHCSLVDSYFIY